MWVTQAACAQLLIINTEHPGEASLWIIVASKYTSGSPRAAGRQRAARKGPYIKLVPAARCPWPASVGCTYSSDGKAS